MDNFERILATLSPYVPLFQSLSWILFVLICAILYRSQVIGLIEIIKKRIREGSSFKAGPVELGEDLQNLQKVKIEKSKPSLKHVDWETERTNIYKKNRGVFLTHIISPSIEKGQKYDIFIYLLLHKNKAITDINNAEFFFGHMWGNKVFKEKEINNGLIGIQTSAYEPFLCTCKVHFEDGTSIKINRYIDFEMGKMIK